LDPSHCFTLKPSEDRRPQGLRECNVFSNPFLSYHRAKKKKKAYFKLIIYFAS
jgi:hypothetical protein